MINANMFTTKLVFLTILYFLVANPSFHPTMLQRISGNFTLPPVKLKLPGYMANNLNPSTLRKYDNNSGALEELAVAVQKDIHKNAERCVYDTVPSYRPEEKYIQQLLKVDTKKAYQDLIDGNVKQTLFALGIEEKPFLSSLASCTRPYMTDKNNVSIVFSKGFSNEQCELLAALMYGTLQAAPVSNVPKIYQITSQKTDPFKMPGATSPSLTYPNNYYDILLAPQLNTNELTAVFIHEMGHWLDLHPHLLLVAHEQWNKQRSVFSILWNHKKFETLHNQLKKACEMVADTKVILSLTDLEKALTLTSCMIETYFIRLLCEKIKCEESGEYYKETNLVLAGSEETHPTWGARIVYMLKLFDLLNADLNGNMQAGQVPVSSVPLDNSGTKKIAVEPLKNIFYTQEIDQNIEWEQYINNGLTRIDEIVQELLCTKGVEWVLRFVLRDVFDYEVKIGNSLLAKGKSFEQWIDEQLIDQKIDLDTQMLLENCYQELHAHLNELIINMPECASSNGTDRKQERHRMNQFSDRYTEHLLSILKKKV